MNKPICTIYHDIIIIIIILFIGAFLSTQGHRTIKLQTKQRKKKKHLQKTKNWI